MSLNADSLRLSYITLPSWTAASLEDAQNQSNFTLISAGNATLAGYPAYKIVYIATIEDLCNRKVAEIFTFKDSKVYTMNYRTIPEYYDTHRRFSKNDGLVPDQVARNNFPRHCNL